MRKAKPKKRILLPDPKFNDPYVTRFINNLMYDGKKTVAFRIFYDSLDIVADKMKMRRRVRSRSGNRLLTISLRMLR
jgi:small subunit ribosomal protein S7